MRGRGARAVNASPVLIGAVTVLISIVAIFLAYSANSGLPFVPTYDLKAELPSGAKLVAGNEVRVGGFRVGAVGDIRAKTVERGGRELSVAELDLQLDQDLKPLRADTVVAVRQRSSLGLKYVELVPGASGAELEPGDTLPLEQARAQVEIEDVLSIFDEETRESARGALVGYGDAFNGRGSAINATLAELPAFLRHLTPVMRRLSAPRTELDELFKQIGRAAAQAAPVAAEQAELFTFMADTFEALARDPEALRETISRSPPTLQTAIRSFRVQQPFLRDFTRLSRELEPAAASLPRSLPRINRALDRGQPTLRRVPRLSRSTIDTFRALDELAENPNTNLALRDLDRTVDIAAPLLTFVSPYQTVCNYWNYWWTQLAEHLSEPVRNGTIERVGLVTTNETQDDRLGGGDADKPADVPRGQDPTTAKAADGNPLTKLNTQFYGPAVDARGRADCQAGQTGYPDGPLNTGGRFGEHVVIDSDTPGRRGGTYKSRELGIDGLEDVP